MPVIKRGSRLGSLCIALVILAACAAPSASPTAPVGSGQPAAATAAPAQGESKPAAAPKGESGVPAAQTPSWQAEWERTIEAAKREKLIIATMPGANDQRLMAAFQKAFPDIPVEHTGAR